MDPEVQSSYFDKSAKAIQWRKNSLSNKWCWSDWTSTSTNMNLDLTLIPHAKTNSERIRDLLVKHKTINFLGDNTGENLWNLGLDEGFSDTILKS